ncbi:MAG: hypothetical protein JSR46_06630 [Verrucomicrobia bacterium]|nr:hypothetical protein [Verrucomicrobiota bacterium]
MTLPINNDSVTQAISRYNELKGEDKNAHVWLGMKVENGQVCLAAKKINFWNYVERFFGFGELNWDFRIVDSCLTKCIEDKTFDRKLLTDFENNIESSINKYKFRQDLRIIGVIDNVLKEQPVVSQQTEKKTQEPPKNQPSQVKEPVKEPVKEQPPIISQPIVQKTPETPKVQPSQVKEPVKEQSSIPKEELSENDLPDGYDPADYVGDEDDEYFQTVDDDVGDYEVEEEKIDYRIVEEKAATRAVFISQFGELRGEKGEYIRNVDIEGALDYIEGDMLQKAVTSIEQSGPPFKTLPVKEQKRVVEAFLGERLGEDKEWITPETRQYLEEMFLYDSIQLGKEPKDNKLDKAGLYKINAITAELKKQKLKLGPSRDDGDCFFDAVRDRVLDSKAPVSEYKDENTARQRVTAGITTLRKEVKEYVEKNKKVEATSELVMNDAGQVYESVDDYLAKIPETFVDRSDGLWGRSNIEGKFIAEIHKVTVQVFEAGPNLNCLHNLLDVVTSLNTTKNQETFLAHLQTMDKVTDQLKLIRFLRALKFASSGQSAEDAFIKALQEGKKPMEVFMSIPDLKVNNLAVRFRFLRNMYDLCSSEKRMYIGANEYQRFKAAGLTMSGPTEKEGKQVYFLDDVYAGEGAFGNLEEGIVRNLVDLKTKAAGVDQLLLATQEAIKDPRKRYTVICSPEEPPKDRPVVRVACEGKHYMPVRDK